MPHFLRDRAETEAPNRVFVDGEKIDRLIALMEPVNELAVVQLRILRAQFPDAFRDTVDPTLNRSTGDASSTQPFRALDEPPSDPNPNLATEANSTRPRPAGPWPQSDNPPIADGVKTEPDADDPLI